MGATREVHSAEEVVLGSGAGPAEGHGGRGQKRGGTGGGGRTGLGGGSGAGPVEEAGLPKRGPHAALSQRLEHSLDALHLSSFGLMDTTLEEVFLKVSEEDQSLENSEAGETPELLISSAPIPWLCQL